MALPTNKFETKIRQDDDSFICEITNGSISICVSNDGEEEDMQAIVDALNKPNVKWYSNNKLELDQHIEIMQLQDELRHEKEKSQKLAEALEEAKRLIDFVDKNIEIPENLFESYSNDLMNLMYLIDESGLSDYNQSKGGKE